MHYSSMKKNLDNMYSHQKTNNFWAPIMTIQFYNDKEKIQSNISLTGFLFPIRL